MKTEHQLTDRKSQSKRILVNTLLMFFRMIGLMILNLYIVRLTLRGLGVVDYGVYNVVAGVVLTAQFITTTLAIAIQRFYSYSLGKKDYARLQIIFSASINIIIIGSIIMLCLGESVGLWFVKTQMIIPQESYTSAVWVFHFAIITLIVNFFNLPFTAAIFSHEELKYYTVISLLDYFLRLAMVIIVCRLAAGRMYFYGLGLLLIATIILITYIFIGRIRYTECRYRKVFDKSIYSELLSFSGWSLYGSLAGTASTHGTNMLLNLFFGPVSNAAYTVSMQLYNAANSVVTSVVMAIRPSMVKSYGEGNYNYLDKLFYVSNKGLIYLLLCVVLPLIHEMPLILKFWVGNTSYEMIVFCRLYLVYLLVLSLHNPITTIIHSVGNIRNYSLVIETMMLMIIPTTYLLFRHGLPSHYCFISMIAISAAAHTLRLYFLRHLYPRFSIVKYIRTLLGPLAIVIATGCAVLLMIQSLMEESLLRILVSIIAIAITISIMVVTIGIDADERKVLKEFSNKIKSKLGICVTL